MRCEIPECRRCLFCIPLRSGIFLFGYLNLLFSILLMYIEAWLGWGEPATASTLSMYRGVAIFTQLWLPIVLYSLEIIFNIVLIIGAHTRRKVLLRTYYYYGMTTTVATFLVLMVLFMFDNGSPRMGSIHIIDMLAGICGFVVHIYLLLLIRSELKKPRYRSGVTFVNQAAEIVSPPPWSDGRNPL
ncbi:hypothetical protein evm_012518 [Chilo suppressalis]|nr:hypothetical protein evm_012518 [Chilo suppressalis]